MKKFVLVALFAFASSGSFAQDDSKSEKKEFKKD